MAAISDDTKSMIEDHVKKGKARKFFLIYKGASIKTLVVFKKGPFGPKILSAKKDGFKGEVAYGVVTGSGKNLFFQLPGTGDVAAAMKVDSFQAKPPTKSAKLREFLKDEGLKFKPTYHIITDLANAPDPEAESSVPVAPPPPGSEAGDEEGDEADSGAVESTDEEKWQQRYDALQTDMLKALQDQLGDTGKIRAVSGFAQGKAEAGEFAAALKALEMLEGLVKAALGASSPSAPTAGDSAAAEATEEAKWNQRYGALEPDMLKALKEQLGDTAKIRAVSGFAQEKAADGDFTGALKALTMLEGLVKAALGASSTSAAGATADPAAMAQWQAVRASAISTLKEVAKEIAAEKHAESAKALIELNAVIKQITAEPKTPQQVAELERYLEQDDVVLDVCELAEDIRTPLLEALEKLKPVTA